MGDRGPIPKREDQRVRRNQEEVPVEKVTAIGVVPVPELGLDDPHDLVVDLYDSLRNSAQNKYYEASDWHYARLAMHFINDLLKFPTQRGSAQKLASVLPMLTSLLMTEGDRRRARLEIERQPPAAGEGGKVLDMSDMLRQRLGGSAN